MYSFKRCLNTWILFTLDIITVGRLPEQRSWNYHAANILCKSPVMLHPTRRFAQSDFATQIIFLFHMIAVILFKVHKFRSLTPWMLVQKEQAPKQYENISLLSTDIRNALFQFFLIIIVGFSTQMKYIVFLGFILLSGM